MKIDTWLENIIPKHESLTNAVIPIITSLLKSNKINYLTVTGRTKNIQSAKEKIKRKKYKHPEIQMMDLSGIRIIAYFESDVTKISDLIKSSFNVDLGNSLNKDKLLAKDQFGYRSIHYICDLGEVRSSLPEFEKIGELKFEVQIRTVLQHAWAELAHDRDYKFSSGLPLELERKLYLYAGMLEVADKGFDELSEQIDKYIEDFELSSADDNYDVDINTLNLAAFTNVWLEKLGDIYFPSDDKESLNELVTELNAFGITKISQLKSIIPPSFEEKAIERGYTTTIAGLVRDWMLINDYKKYHEQVPYDWVGVGEPHEVIFDEYMTPEQLTELRELFD
jgi:Uncharacterized protein conserved in bacteria